MAAQGCWLFFVVGFRFHQKKREKKNNQAQMPLDVIVPYNDIIIV
jgi:hypothetical protein